MEVHKERKKGKTIRGGWGAVLNRGISAVAGVKSCWSLDLG